MVLQFSRPAAFKQVFLATFRGQLLVNIAGLQTFSFANSPWFVDSVNTLMPCNTSKFP